MDTAGRAVAVFASAADKAAYDEAVRATGDGAPQNTPFAHVGVVPASDDGSLLVLQVGTARFSAERVLAIGTDVVFSLGTDSSLVPECVSEYRYVVRCCL